MGTLGWILIVVGIIVAIIIVLAIMGRNSGDDDDDNIGRSFARKLGSCCKKWIGRR